MLITLLTSLVSITAFYGVWTGLDFMFAPTDTKPYGLGLNGAYCAVSFSIASVKRELQSYSLSKT